MAERPEDLNLPNAVVTRIIKDAVPFDVNVSKEARLAISKAASVFVLYATSCSNNFALKNKRKTISAQDVQSAMEDMEFEQFIEPLQACQEVFRLDKQDKKKPAKPSQQPDKGGEEEISDEEKDGQSEAGKGEEEDFIITVNKDVDEESGSSEELVDGD